MRKKQSVALLFAAVSSAAIYSEVQAAEMIQSSDFAVESNFQGAVPLPVSDERIVAAADLPVVTNLNDLQQIIYEEMQNFTTTFQVQYKGDTQQLKSELMDLLIETKAKDDYTLGVVVSYGYNFTGYENDVTLTINLSYTTNAEQEAYVKSEVKRLVAELITPTMSDVEKVKVINEYIVNKTTYSKNTKSSPHAAYTILAEGKGVCQAYATLAYMMLTEAGIEAHYVTGFAKEPHAWNLVKVDGEWYHLDVTWNDPTYTTSFPELAEYISYEYFLISDSVISKDHAIDKRPGLPVAISERFSALRNGLSGLFTYNGISYVLVPEYVNGYLYYVNYENKSYAVDRINLLASVPAVESFASVKAMDILATDQAIYFVDITNNMGLSKIDLATKQVTTLHTANKINSIKKDAQNVYAYSNGKVVFSEPYETAPPEQPGGNNGSGTQLPVTPPGDNNIVVVNNVKLKDTVTVSNVAKGDLIKVYSDASKRKVIGKATAKKDKVVIKISKGLPTEEHVIYVTKQAKGQDEGEAIRVTFDPEKVTDSPSESNIQVANNVGKKKDTITVTNVKAKDVVKVYASAADAANAKAKPLGQATVRRAGEVTVKIRKGFDLASYPGEVYVTVQSYNERNSEPVAVKVEATPKAELNKENITVNNQLGVKADTITVTNVNAKDVIKVYASAADVGNAKAKPVGTAKVKKDGAVTVKVRKGFKDLTEVYVTRTSASLEESLFVTIEVGEDAKATPVTIDDVTFTNNVDRADILTVKNLNVKDIINVYKKGSTTAIGKGTATKLGTVVIKLKEELNVADVIEITRSSRLEAESERVEYTVGNPA